MLRFPTEQVLPERSLVQSEARQRQARSQDNINLVPACPVIQLFGDGGQRQQVKAVVDGFIL
ncbi:hypothetical protein SDC9_107243 [bioreactor metagenome]|uniref:Uncharacterized protein n=1 Tax=bioreactor metagenome TaxID=1076179 RepID=A0A645B4N2_9ZZZZ